MAVTRSEWLVRMGEVLSVDPPTPDEVEVLLDIAGVAAHASERTAAPLTCWMVARAGVNPREAAMLVLSAADVE